MDCPVRIAAVRGAVAAGHPGTRSGVAGLTGREGRGDGAGVHGGRLRGGRTRTRRSGPQLGRVPPAVRCQPPSRTLRGVAHVVTVPCARRVPDGAYGGGLSRAPSDAAQRLMRCRGSAGIPTRSRSRAGPGIRPSGRSIRSPGRGRCPHRPRVLRCAPAGSARRRDGRAADVRRGAQRAVCGPADRRSVRPLACCSARSQSGTGRRHYLLAADRLAGALRAAAFFAGALRTAAFFAGALRTAAFLAGVLAAAGAADLPAAVTAAASVG